MIIDRLLRLSARWRPRTAPRGPRVLILTPAKNAESDVAAYVRGLERLTYPRALISIGLLEGDSHDQTYEELLTAASRLSRRFRRARLWKRDFGYQIPAGLPRHSEALQISRRATIAKARNHLLFHALDDEDWVMWLDIDVVAYPPDLIERLLATGKDIVQPHCVTRVGGQTFDCNAWRDHGRLHMDDLRDEGELVELHAVGGTVLLVRADIHREGLVFPTFLYGRPSPLARPRGELETEGLGIMARDMGYKAWGMPHLEVIHRPW